MRDHLELRSVAAVTGSPHSDSLHAGYKNNHEQQTSRSSRFGVGSQFPEPVPLDRIRKSDVKTQSLYSG